MNQRDNSTQPIVRLTRLLSCGVALGIAALCSAQTAPKHLTDAETLLTNLLASEKTAATWPNVYGSPASIIWNGSQSTAKTECSTFMTALWEHSYNWTSATFKTWMGNTNPDAARYHDAIQAGNGFQQITTVGSILPGDVIAIVYYPEYASPSGHVMMVQAAPQSNSSNPFVANTQQWTISVIDSSDSYHGTSDSRYTHPGGIGEGIFRLYTNPDGTVAGYTWSLLGTSLSSYYPQATTTLSGRHLVIGRLTKAGSPPPP